jgi:hypothetical protein
MQYNYNMQLWGIAEKPCISTLFFWLNRPRIDAERGNQWHSRGQRFDPAYLHQKVKPQGHLTLWFYFILQH